MWNPLELSKSLPVRTGDAGRNIPVRAAGPIDWAVIAYLGCFQLALAYVLLTRGIGKLPALEAALLLLLEPALNPLWTFLVHGETPGIVGSIGGGLVLVATTARALRPQGVER